METYLMLLVMIILLGLWYVLGKKRRATPEMHNVDRYRALLAAHVGFYGNLNGAEQDRFMNETVRFLDRVTIEGVGTTVEDIDRVFVAASAIIPIFAFPGWSYPHLTNVILYPDTFNREFAFEGQDRNTLGMVGDGFMNGQMILSKKSLRAGFKNQQDRRNTGIHEFVHLLDKSDGSVDGIPEALLQQSYVLPWLKAMHTELKRIAQGKSDIDPYALTDEAEFFAVVSEYFFENPERMKERHATLYELLSQMFTPSGQLPPEQEDL